VCSELDTEIPPLLNITTNTAPNRMKAYMAEMQRSYINELRLCREYSKTHYVDSKVILEFNKKYDVRLTKSMLLDIDTALIYVNLIAKDLIESNYQLEWLNATGQTVEHCLVAASKMLEKLEFIKYTPFTRKTQGEMDATFADYLNNRDHWYERRPKGELSCFLEAVLKTHSPHHMVFENDLDKMTLTEFENHLIAVTFCLNTLEHELRALVVTNARDNAQKAMEAMMKQAHIIQFGDDGMEFPPGFLLPVDE